MNTFDSLRTPADYRRHKGCYRCGAETAGTVNIQLREVSKRDTTSPLVKSKQRSFCEECAVDIYVELERHLVGTGGDQ